MRMRKKTAMIVSFALGTLMFATTAMAEVKSKGGYEQGKDALKHTAEALSSKYSTYTLDATIALKNNGEVIFSESTVKKYDRTLGSSEDNSTRINGNTKTQNYYYRDKNLQINHNSNEDYYYVHEYAEPTPGERFDNPFKEEEAGDVERIADALIGNLKDYVVVTENADGSKELSGALNEGQIPAIVNAVVSLQVKNAVRNNNRNSASTMPKVTKDVYVKEVKGKATLDKDGLIQSIFGTGTIYGKDEEGKEQNLTFELLAKITDVNSTVVSKPDLTGKKVEKTVERDYNKVSNPQLYIGKYKNDIIIEKDGKVVKIGERILDIEKLDDKSISGKYHEEYKSGYESYASKDREFSFNGEFEKGQLDARFNNESTSGKNVQGSIYLNTRAFKISFYIDSSNDRNYDGDFSRVVD